nr:hypothetical protein [Pseudomonas chlororaphis]
MDVPYYSLNMPMVVQGDPGAVVAQEKQVEVVAQERAGAQDALVAPA